MKTAQPTKGDLRKFVNVMLDNYKLSKENKMGSANAYAISMEMSGLIRSFSKPFRERVKSIVTEERNKRK